MLFNSIPFLFFFPISVILFFLVPVRFRNVWLLLCSYVFYLSQGQKPYAIVFLLYSTLLTWITCDIIYKRGLNFKKISLFICVILNLLPLVLFNLTGSGLFTKGSSGTADLLAPIGISFYTLQTVTYVIDCYKGEMQPEKSFVNYALYVSFFPYILSGPIERAKSFLPQLRDPKGEGEDIHRFDPIRVKEGLFCMLWGYFLKLVVSSRLHILTDLVYSNYKTLSGAEILAGVIAYSIELYCDFAGYSAIAFGAARVLGFSVSPNFKQPYFSLSVSEFWRRWHISLSSWLRQYIYIPLGGNRRGRGMKYRNVLVVFLASGFWHGADPTFLLWGLLHGICQVIEDCGKAVFDRIGKCLRVFITYVIVMLLWIPFRAKDLSEAAGVFLGLFKDFSLKYWIDGSLTKLGLGTYNLLFVTIATVIVLIFDLVCHRKECEIYSVLDHTKVYLRFAFYYLLIIMILFSTNLSTTEFLYQGF